MGPCVVLVLVSLASANLKLLRPSEFSHLARPFADEEWVIVLTDKGYYKMEHDSNAPRRRKDITSLHRHWVSLSLSSSAVLCKRDLTGKGGRTLIESFLSSLFARAQCGGGP